MYTIPAPTTSTDSMRHPAVKVPGTLRLKNHPEPEHDSANQHGQYESTPNDLGQYADVGSFGALTETPTTTMASVSNITAWDQPASTAGYSSGIATSGALAHSTLPNYDFNASTHPVQTSYYGLQNPFTDNQAKRCSHQPSTRRRSTPATISNCEP